MDARRIHPEENTNLTAIEQANPYFWRLPRADKVSLFVFDAGYDAVRLTQELDGDRALSWGSTRGVVRVAAALLVSKISLSLPGASSRATIGKPIVPSITPGGMVLPGR